MRLYILISSVFTRQRWGFAVRSGILDADCLVLHLESESRVLKATLLVDCVGCSDRESGSDPTFRRRRGKDPRPVQTRRSFATGRYGVSFPSSGKSQRNPLDWIPV